MNNKFRTFKNYAVYVLFFFLPSWRLIQNIVLALLLILPPYNKNIKKSSFLTKTLILFLTYFFFNSLFNGTLNEEISNLIKILPLILIPYTFEKVEKNIIINGLFALFLGVVIIQLIAVYGIIDYLYFYKGKKYELTNYTKLNDIIRFERPYLGYFSALNILLSYLFFKRKKKWYFIIFGIFSILLMSYISARLALIVGVIFIVYILWEEIKPKKTKIAVITIISVASIFYITLSNTSIKKRFSLIKKDSRTIIWEGAFYEIKTFKDYMFGNASLNQIRRNLLNFYKEYEHYENKDVKNRFVKKNYNTHNQFINEIIRGGLVGLILFCFPLIYILRENLLRKNVINILLLTSVIMFLLVENLLERQIGIYTLAIIMSITSLSKYSYISDKSSSDS